MDAGLTRHLPLGKPFVRPGRYTSCRRNPSVFRRRAWRADLHVQPSEQRAPLGPSGTRSYTLQRRERVGWGSRRGAYLDVERWKLRARYGHSQATVAGSGKHPMAASRGLSGKWYSGLAKPGDLGPQIRHEGRRHPLYGLRCQSRTGCGASTVRCNLYLLHDSQIGRVFDSTLAGSRCNPFV